MLPKQQKNDGTIPIIKEILILVEIIVVSNLTPIKR